MTPVEFAIRTALAVLMGAAILIFVTSCGPVPRVFDTSHPPPTAPAYPPIVTANSQATARLTLIACPMTPTGGQLLQEYLQSLSQMAPVVTATEAGTAALTLNLCSAAPTPELVRAARGR